MKKILTVFVLTIFSETIWATAQTGELIIYEGDTLALFSLPLEDYLGESDNRGKYHPALKDGCSTALWRGYVGLWKLENNELFLIDVYVCGHRDKSIFSNLFDKESPINADWYSGQLAIQHGKLIKYHHSGFSRYFEEETLIELRNGDVISKKRFKNGIRENDNGFPRDSVMNEVYQRISWNEISDFSKDKKLYVTVSTGKIDSISIQGKLDGIYLKVLKDAMKDFPQLTKFYVRDEPLQEAYIFPVVFSRKSKKKIRSLANAEVQISNLFWQLSCYTNRKTSSLDGLFLLAFSSAQVVTFRTLFFVDAVVVRPKLC